MEKLDEFRRWYGKTRENACAIDLEMQKFDKDIAVCGMSWLRNGMPEYRSLIHNQNLSKKNLKQYLKYAKAILTFNGNWHDIPKIEEEFGRILPARARHFDLYEISGLLGYRCSLQRLEAMLGIERKEEIRTGAIRLWQRYKATGRTKYLQQLLTHNYYDTTNLHKLADKLWKMANENYGGGQVISK